MRSCLYEIQDVAMQIAEAMSIMLQVDVEIVDSNHIIIAGTGAYADMVNTSNENEGHGYKSVIEEGKKLLINEPTKSYYCQGCSVQDTCEVLFEAGAPIILDNTIHGAIGITCWKKEQEDFFLNHLEDAMFFLDQMCSLIASKLKERINMQNQLSAKKLLSTMMQMVDKGVIVLNRDKQLVEYNKIAEREFKLDDTMIGKAVNVIVTGDMVTDREEYKVIIDKSIHTVIGDYEYLDEQDHTYNSVLIFDSMREYRDKVYHMAYFVMPQDINAIVGHSQYVKNLKSEILLTATNNSPVLIEGEEGSGKKIVGTAIWKASQRSEKPFVYFNCSSVQEELLEERLFGATNRMKNSIDRDLQGTLGVVEMANDGILFLDEIEELPLCYQVKLEQVIEEGFIQRKGSVQNIPVNVRIIASTQKNLLKLIERKKFRKNLYYMIGVSKITVYPLRKRRVDIPDLVDYYIQLYKDKYRIPFRSIEPEVMELLKQYDWHGNITELDKTIEYMMNAMEADGIMDIKTVPTELFETSEEQEEVILTLEQLELREIQKAMRKYGDTKKGKQQAAEALGIGIATLYRKLERI